MGLGQGLIDFYFEHVYTPIYDVTVGQFTAYRELQEGCVNRFRFGKKQRVLCVGVGTGNEINYFRNGKVRNVEIVGVDLSERALIKARQKGSKLGMDVKLLKMDARRLDFPTESFDDALCVHVMDWVDNVEDATREILRVLRPGGQYVITYPAKKEGAGLGASVLMEGLRQNIKSRRFIRALVELLSVVILGIIYTPFLFRPRQKAYAKSEIEEMLQKLGGGSFQIEIDGVYCDIIVSGRKLKGARDAKERRAA